jgi:hypothetical protein
MNVDRSLAYVGVHACGCVTAVTCPMPGDEKGTALFVADIINRGMNIECTTVGDARSRLAFECPHDPKGWERDPAVTAALVNEWVAA